MTEFLLVRHASPESGGTDPGLTPHGRSEAAALARRLRARSFDAVWSSDLGRAVETTGLLLAGREAPEPALSPLLREVDPPAEGLLARDPAGYAAWEKGATRELAEGLSTWLRTAASPSGRGDTGDGRDAHAPCTILVVSHAGPLRVLICLLLGLPPEAHWSFHLDWASLSVVRRGADMGTILLLNDRCHLDGLANPVETRYIASLQDLRYP